MGTLRPRLTSVYPVLICQNRLEALVQREKNNKISQKGGEALWAGKEQHYLLLISYDTGVFVDTVSDAGFALICPWAVEKPPLIVDAGYSRTSDLVRISRSLMWMDNTLSYQQL